MSLRTLFSRTCRLRRFAVLYSCVGLIILAGTNAFAQEPLAPSTRVAKIEKKMPGDVLAQWGSPGIPNAPQEGIDSLTGSAAPTATPPEVELTLSKGTPLRLIIHRSLPVKKVGEPIQAYVAEPVYAFDRVVVPKGSEVDGHIVQLIHRSFLKRFASYLNADFSRHRTVRVEFDTLILPSGAAVPLDTKVLPHVGPVLKLETNPQKNGMMHRARGLISSQWHAVISEIKPSALWHHAKSFARSEWPYHKQTISAGSVFVTELKEPIDFGPAAIPASEMGSMGEMPKENTEAHARLVTPLSSATSHVGAKVDAVLTRPVFSANKKLLLPVNTELQGIVVRAKPAERLHRNGKLRFKLIRVKLPSGAPKQVELALEGLQVAKSSNIQVDAEGTPHVAKKTESRVLRTALSLAIANSTMDSDSGHAGATARSENRPLGGASGYKLIGFAVSFAAASPMLSRVMGFWGAGESVYFHFITRGQNLVLPKDTPMEVSFGGPHVRPIHLRSHSKQSARTGDRAIPSRSGRWK